MFVDKLLQLNRNTVIIFFANRPPFVVFSDTGRAYELAWLILGVNTPNLEDTQITFCAPAADQVGAA